MILSMRYSPTASSFLLLCFVLGPLVISVLSVVVLATTSFLTFSIMSSDHFSPGMQGHDALPTTCYIPILVNCIDTV